MARQPEAAGDIRGSMIITAAFIEGISLFAVVVCLLVALNTGDEKVLAAVRTGGRSVIPTAALVVALAEGGSFNP
jgi:hypothetical protein